MLKHEQQNWRTLHVDADADWCAWHDYLKARLAEWQAHWSSHGRELIFDSKEAHMALVLTWS